MRFLSQEDIDQMPAEKQNEYWLSLFQKGEAAAMFFEGFFFFVLLLSFAMSIEFPPKIAWLGWIATSGLLIAGVVLILFLVSLQQISFAQFIKAVGTPSWKDDLGKGIVAAAIMILAWWADSKGGGAFLNYINGYDPKITEKYEDDKRVATNQKDVLSLQSERDKRVSSTVCAECAIVKSRYDKKIAAKRATLRAKEWDAAWKKTVNDKIRADIRALEAEREAEIVGAQGRYQIQLDSIRNSYDVRINGIDTALTSLKSQIDSANISEKQKAKLQEEENRHYGGGLSILTQLVLLLCRYMQVRMWRKAGKEFVAIGEFMSSSSIFNVWFERVSIWYFEQVERQKIKTSVRYAEAFSNLDIYAEDLIGNDEAIRPFIENKVNNLQQARILYDKNNPKKTAQNVAIMDEKAILLDYISDCELALIPLDPSIDVSEIETLNEIIDDCNLALAAL